MTQDLATDPRFRAAVALFNQAEWYPCHDRLEELWQETQGPDRPALQGLLQIAVAHLHLERGNRRGATVLIGEGLGRLAPCGSEGLGLDLSAVRSSSGAWLQALQRGEDPSGLPLPRLVPCSEADGPELAPEGVPEPTARV